MLKFIFSDLTKIKLAGKGVVEMEEVLPEMHIDVKVGRRTGSWRDLESVFFLKQKSISTWHIWTYVESRFVGLNYCLVDFICGASSTHFRYTLS